MPQALPESDWKLLRGVWDAAYDRHCAETLQKAKALIENEHLDVAERFQKLQGLLKKRGKELNLIFGAFNFSRSNSLIILVMLNNWNLVTAEELGRFSQPVQNHLKLSLEDEMGRD